MDTGRVVKFCKMLLQKAVEKYGDPMDASTNLDSNYLSVDAMSIDEVLTMIEQITLNSSALTAIETLDYEPDAECGDHDDGVYELEDEDSEDLVCNMPNSEQSSQEWDELQIENQTFSLDVMTNVVKFYDKCKKNAFQQTQKRYPFVTHYLKIYRFREYVANNGRKSDKLKDVEQFVFQKFLDARNSFACVSERDLMRWGKNKAREIDLDFKASRKWIHLLKIKCRIV